MARKRPNSREAKLPDGRRRGAVPLSAIRGFARRVAERFRPDKIVLFGSHAYGRPHPDSDVDVLVVMPARSPGSMAYKIRLAIPAPFPMDLIVRTPEDLRRRLAEEDLFHTQILSRGKVLYEKGDPRVGEKGRGRLPRRARPGTPGAPPCMTSFAFPASSVPRNT
jgi:predicted nucleotidyltransferase